VRVLAAIQRFRPDILMVGMGMPQQEHWDSFRTLPTSRRRVILTSGACMELRRRRGARRLHGGWDDGASNGSIGSVRDPARLWKPYLVEPWFVLRLFFRDLSGKP
jgi:N-acetylglucosaminyldiphosphoundecaprenol N-acetyl-beta-D-mannosaminyltransferase